MLHLTLPHILHRSRYLDMLREWKEFEVTPTSPKRLFAGENYEEFLSLIIQDLTDSPRGVNSSLFFFMEDENILGALQIRHHIDHPDLRDSGGHIGYGLRPSARGRGLAKKMLSLGLLEARHLGIDTLMLSADDDNPASWRTIESCSGILEKIIEKEGKPLRIYRINPVTS